MVAGKLLAWSVLTLRILACRYTMRSPLSRARLSKRTSSGNVLVTLPKRHLHPPLAAIRVAFDTVTPHHFSAAHTL